MFSTYTFTFSTDAAPERVWGALTDGRLTAQYLHGLRLDSDWAAGSPVSFQTGGAIVSSGEVLSSEQDSRLSYTIDGGAGPDTYVTWSIRGVDRGAIVSLLVDDPEGQPEAEAQDDWLPVIAALQAVLAVDEDVSRTENA
jgi:uncharacterized protein YndB with AHSA1/START domain